MSALPPAPLADEDAALIEAFCDETADEAALFRLRARLGDAGFRAELAWALRLRGLAGASDSAAAFAAGVMNRCEDLREPQVEEVVMRRLACAAAPGVAFPPRRRRWPVAAVVAQTLALAGVVAWMFGAGEAGRPVVASVTDPGAGESFLVREGERLALARGLPVLADDFVYTDSLSAATLAWTDGSTVRLAPFSHARLRVEHGAKRLAVFSGAAQLDVRPQPEGAPLEVITAHSRCVVRGTRFDVSASAALTQLQVAKGAVEMRSREAAAGVAVRGGECSLVESGGAPRVSKVGDPVYASPVLTKAGPGGRRVAISAPLAGARKLYLVVTNGGDNNRYDHAAWVAPRLVGPEGVLELSTWPWVNEKSGLGTFRNRGFFGETPAVDGVPLTRCVVTHATSVIEYDIPPGYDRFEAEGALLDSGVNQPESCPSLAFEVYVSIPAAKLDALRVRRMHY